eukprot:SAG31_NODE_1065_length_10096_cov_7.151530_3_plen_131_part_00
MRNTGVSKAVPGQGAIRIGKWKLLRGFTCNWGQRDATYGCGSCATRDGNAHPGIPYKNLTAATSPPFCPNGWLPPPESRKTPEPPPDVDCDAGLPCLFNSSDYIDGGTVSLCLGDKRFCAIFLFVASLPL